MCWPVLLHVPNLHAVHTVIYLPKLPVQPLSILLTLMHICSVLRSSTPWSTRLTTVRHSGALPTGFSDWLECAPIHAWRYVSTYANFPPHSIIHFTCNLPYSLFILVRISLYAQLQCMPISPLTKSHFGGKHTSRSLSPTISFGLATKQSATT